jgi:8-oxo-dGTP pyrophosphatase MutT (NUDIX family)
VTARKTSRKATPKTAAAGTTRLQTRTEISSGGVVYRRRGARLDVALIAVGDPPRWQLPKGLVDKGERPEETAVREVREEAGIESIVVAPLERIGYWYQRTEKGTRVRVRKFVHFFLLRYRSGSVRNHDHEVSEARWVPLADAPKMLAFAGERTVLGEALQRLEGDAR